MCQLEATYQFMKNWQQEHDEEVNVIDPKVVKYYLEYDIWSHRFFVESCVGYVGIGVVYFSSKKKAQEFLAQYEKELNDLIKKLKRG